MRRPASRFITLTIIACLGSVACAPNPLAENRTMTHEVLARGGPDLPFKDASTSARAAVRHARSGMVCVLPKSGAFNLEAFPADAGNEGAFCTSSSSGEVVTLLAVKFAQPVGLDAAFSDSLSRTLAQAAPQPWRGAPSAADVAPPAPGTPHFRIARFEGAVNGEPSYVRVAMSEANGWFIQQIVSAPVSKAPAVEAEAGKAWREILSAFAAAQPPQPASAAAASGSARAVAP